MSDGSVFNLSCFFPLAHSRDDDFNIVHAGPQLAGKLPSMQPLKTLPSFFKSDDIEVQIPASNAATDASC